MLWIKAFHIIFLVSWYAGLFYLPRLFVYHAMARDEGDEASMTRLKVMERKLYYFVAPWAILTLALGTWLWLGYGFRGGWLHVKLLLVLFLVGYHLWCGQIVKNFAAGREQHSHIWFRWFNEFPLLILVAVTLLVVLKPF